MARTWTRRGAVTALLTCCSPFCLAIMAPAAGAVGTTTTVPAVTTSAPTPGQAFTSTASGSLTTAQKAAWQKKAAWEKAEQAKLASADPPSAVPAGLGPVDHRVLASQLIAAGLAIAGAGALVGRRRVSARRRGVVALSAATACGALVPISAANAQAVSVGWVPAAAAHTPSAAGAPPAAAARQLAAARVAISARVAPVVTPAWPASAVWDPVTLSIPALAVDAPVRSVAVSGAGALEVPRQPTTLGWWSAGPLPGWPTGTAVIAGHVNYGGTEGAFANLSHLLPGDSVTVAGPYGSERFTVTGVREYPKSTLPWSTLFSVGGPGRLALVTCGGAFDPATGHYADNVVAFALPAAAT